MAFTKVVGAGIHTLSNIASHNINSSGIITATKFVGPFDGTNGDFSGDVTIDGNLTVNGTTTTLDTNLTEVDKVEVAANNSTVGVAITQSGTGDIFNLYDGSTEVFSVADGGAVSAAGNITISNTDPQLAIHDTNHNPSHYYLKGVGGAFKITDSTNGDRLSFNANGSTSVTASLFNIVGGAQVSSNLGVTGNLLLTDNIIHDGDPDTKIRFPAADTISMETAGSTRFGLSSSGNVEIHGTQTGNNVAMLYNGSSGFGFYASSNSGVNRDFRFYSSNSNSNESFRISSGGNVNIGGDYDQTSYVTSITNTANTNLFRIKTADLGDYDLRFNIQNGESHMWHYGTDDFVIGNRYSRKLHLITNAQKRLTIHGDFVGINTATPNTYLQVKGTGRLLKLETTASSGGQCYIDFNDETAARASIGMRGSSSDTLTLAALNGSMRFDVSGRTQALQLDTSGNILQDSSGGLSYFKGSSEYIFGSNTSSPPSGGAEAKFQVHDYKTRATMSLNAYMDNAGAPVLEFISSRSGTPGTLGTKAALNDYHGDIRFYGDNGTNYNSLVSSAQILVKQKSTISDGDTICAGEMSFYTGSGTGGSMLERLKIDLNGNLSLGAQTNNSDIHSSFRCLQVYKSAYIWGYSSSSYPAVHITNNARPTASSFTQTWKRDLAGTYTAPVQLELYTGNFNVRTADDSTANSVINWDTRFTVTQAGKIGINKSSPEVALHMTNDDASPYIRNENTGSNSSYTGLSLKTPTVDCQIWNQGPNGSGYGGTNSMNFYQSGTYGAFAFYHGNDERVRISSNGNMGVGTNNPVAKFVVSKANGEGVEFVPGSRTDENDVYHYDRGSNVYCGYRTYATKHEFWRSGTAQAVEVTPAGNLKVYHGAGLRVSTRPESHSDYVNFETDNHGNTVVGLNLALNYSGASGTHQVKQVNAHSSIGSAGMFIGGNGSGNNTDICFFRNGQGNSAQTVFGQQSWRFRIGDGEMITNYGVKHTNRGFFYTSTSGQTATNAPSLALGLSYGFGYQEAYSTTNGTWVHPYPDLVLAYHTGVSLGAYWGYGGCRFFQDHPSGNNSTVLEVGNGGTGVHVTNTFTAGTKTFRIAHPHPSKKYTHDLVHSVIEGPQCDNIYRGKIDLVDGTATVNIDTVSNMTDGTFVLLNRDVQCFTSNETGWTAVKGSVTGNILTITAQDNTCTDTISWMVVGERQDDKIKSVEITDENGKLIMEPLTIEATHM